MSTISRVSIIVPLVKDNADFESTLASVLQHRPAGCEVIVPHDGSYRDPFELADEVRFVTSDSANFVNLVRAAVPVCQARFVHIIASGLLATDQWMTPALQHFGSPRVASVAPSIVDAQTSRLISAGWEDTRQRLFCPAAGDLKDTGKLVLGCYLQASFWRHRVLQSLLNTIRDSLMELDTISYLMGHLLQAADWQVRNAVTSKICLQTPRVELAATQQSRLLCAIRHVVTGEPSPTSLVRSSIGVLTGQLPFAEWIGQRSFKSAIPRVEQAIDPDELIVYDDNDAILEYPSDQGSQRRAA